MINTNQILNNLVTAQGQKPYLPVDSALCAGTSRLDLANDANVAGEAADGTVGDMVGAVAGDAFYGVPMEVAEDAMAKNKSNKSNRRK